MLKVWGFAELKPEQKIIEEKIFEIVKRNYQKYGYTPIETPAVERTEVLTAKWWWEATSQIYGVYWLAQWASDLKKYSLRFDLTVPLARYVIDHRNELTFPFKKSFIAKVWRGERQQRWRSREFYQADIDVIWENNDQINGAQNLFYDAEVISIVYKTYGEIFQEFNLEGWVEININNKKIISWLLQSLWLEDQSLKVFGIIDSIAKISREDFDKNLKWAWCSELQIETINNFVRQEINIEKLSNLSEEFWIENEVFLEWIFELTQIMKFINMQWSAWEGVKINFWIVRGLEYYTGTVFETVITTDRKLGSIAWWGRYEWLTKYLDKKADFSWVGFSMWITRFEDYLFEKLDSEKLAKTTSEYLIINFEETVDESLKLYQKLAEEWKKIEFYPESAKLKKQFKYADGKGITYCIMLGSGELEKWVYSIKNMETWESEEIKMS